MVYICTVGSRKLEYGSGRIQAGFPSSLGFEVGGQSKSSFLASMIGISRNTSAIYDRSYKGVQVIT